MCSDCEGGVACGDAGDDRDELAAHLRDAGELREERPPLTDSQREACEALIEQLTGPEGDYDACDYCNFPLVRATFERPDVFVTISHCLNCGAHYVGLEGERHGGFD